MVKLPWGSRGDDAPGPNEHAAAVVACEFQDGTLAVYEDELVIERVPRSRFSDKTIPLDAVTGVEYDGGITVGYLQIQQRGVEADGAGMFSDPVDENTLHFTRGDRACAERARDAIREAVGLA